MLFSTWNCHIYVNKLKLICECAEKHDWKDKCEINIQFVQFLIHLLNSANHSQFAF